MNLSCYLNLLSEQKYGVAPNPPVQNPQGGRPAYQGAMQPNVPQAKPIPVPPQVTQQKQVPKKNMNPVQNKEQEKKAGPKSYFNYMLWTSKILKQGEIFRKNCYSDNCNQFEIGTGDRRICKDRCDIETCKKVIALLRASIGKCKDSNYPDKCKVRYLQLIPLYQEKLNDISKKFIKGQNIKKKQEIKVG